jgi:hypothetical protein
MNTTTTTPTYYLVRHGKAPKLGLQSVGQISYAVLLDDERAEPHLILTGNDGGGFFNKEPVPISALRECVETAPAKMNANAIKSAFIGGSNNNAYFMVAVLCHEKLLKRAPREGAGRGQPVSDTANWDKWVEQVQTAADELGDDIETYSLSDKEVDAETVPIPADQSANAIVTPPDEVKADEPTAAVDAAAPDIESVQMDSANPKPRKKSKAKV